MLAICSGIAVRCLLADLTEIRRSSGRAQSAGNPIMPTLPSGTHSCRCAHRTLNHADASLSAAGPLAL